MDYLNFIEANNRSTGNKAFVDYTLFEMNLIRLNIRIVETDDGTVEQTKYISMQDLYDKVHNNKLRITNPEALKAYSKWTNIPIKYSHSLVTV